MQCAIFHRRFSAVCLLFCSALLAAACLQPSARAAARVVTDADKGATVQLKLGDTLEVRLRSNPTTGYQWYVHMRSTPLLRLTGQSQTSAQQPGVGRPIVQVFRFQAVSAGSGVLLLEYIRAWERPPAKSNPEQFDLRVNIR
jgi:inhibitor of cysteine peptidase